MDKDLTASEKRRYKIEPPSEATVSTFLNNIGNGAMLGAAPVVMLNFYDEMLRKPISEATHRSRGKWGLAMTATGCALGAILGVEEARRLQTYRHAISDEIAGLRAEVNANAEKLKSWTGKEEKRQTVSGTEMSKG